MNEALKPLIIDAQTSIREALGAIDRSKRQICLVLDGDGKLVATVTDGDVRRRILNDFDLDATGTLVVREYEHQIPYGVMRSEFDSVFKG